MLPFVFEVPMLEFIFKKSVAGSIWTISWYVAGLYHKSVSQIWVLTVLFVQFPSTVTFFCQWLRISLLGDFGDGPPWDEHIIFRRNIFGLIFPTITANRRLLKCLIIVNPDEQIPSNSFPRCGGIKPKPRTPQGGFALPFSLLPVSSCVVLQTSPNLPSLSLSEFGCFYV